MPQTKQHNESTPFQENFENKGPIVVRFAELSRMTESSFYCKCEDLLRADVETGRQTESTCFSLEKWGSIKILIKRMPVDEGAFRGVQPGLHGSV